MQHLIIDICKALPYFYAIFYFLDAIQCQALMEKVNEPFLILGWKVKRKTI